MSNLRAILDTPELAVMQSFDELVCSTDPEVHTKFVDDFLAWREWREKEAANKHDPQMTRIAGVVMRHAKLRPAQFYAHRRDRRFSWPRIIAIHIILSRVDVSLVDVGHFMGRCHTTVQSADRRAAILIEKNAQMRALHDAVVAELDGHE